MTNKIAIVGAGGVGREVLSLLMFLNKYEFIGFFDDGIVEQHIKCRYKIIGNTDTLKNEYKDINLAIGIASTQARQKLYQKLNQCNFIFPPLIHPSATIGNNISIGEGTIIQAQTILNADISIGKFCLINASSSICHDTMIHDFCTLHVGVKIASPCIVNENTFIGPGSIISKIRGIEKNTTIPANSNI